MPVNRIRLFRLIGRRLRLRRCGVLIAGTCIGHQRGPGQRPHRQALFGVFHESVEDMRRQAAAGRGQCLVLCMARELSLPIHTPVTRSAVKPTNQASCEILRRAGLAGAGPFVQPRRLAGAGGRRSRPSSASSGRIVGGDITARRARRLALNRTLPSVVRMLTMPKGITPSPPLAKAHRRRSIPAA